MTSPSLLKTTSEKRLLNEIRQLIEQSKQTIVSTANTELVALSWHMGKLIKSRIMADGRAEYGKQIVASLSQQLTLEFGRGFTRSSLFRMIQFCEVFPDFEIVATLSRQLGWSHFIS